MSSSFSCCYLSCKCIYMFISMIKQVSLCQEPQAVKYMLDQRSISVGYMFTFPDMSVQSEPTRMVVVLYSYVPNLVPMLCTTHKTASSRYTRFQDFMWPISHLFLFPQQLPMRFTSRQCRHRYALLEYGLHLHDTLSTLSQTKHTKHIKGRQCVSTSHFVLLSTLCHIDSIQFKMSMCLSSVVYLQTQLR